MRHRLSICRLSWKEYGYHNKRGGRIKVLVVNEIQKIHFGIAELVGRLLSCFSLASKIISLNIQQSSINVICNKEVKETGNSFYSKIHITSQVQEMLKQYKTRS